MSAAYRTRTCGYRSSRLARPTTGLPRRWRSPACRQAAYARRRRRRPVSNEWWTAAHVRQRIVAERAIVPGGAACFISRLALEYLGLNHPDSARRDALAFSDWHAVALAAAEGPRTRVAWLQPPQLPSKTLGEFLARAAATAQAGTGFVALVPSASGTRCWWDHVVGLGAQVEFLRGRVPLDVPDSAAATVGPRACALVNWVSTCLNADPSGVYSQSPGLHDGKA